MNCAVRYAIFITLIVFAFFGINTTDVTAQTRLGLHVTQEEVNVWKQRAQSGPYRVAGDAQINSPGDWTRILNNANAFRAAGNTSETWGGQPGGSCWSNDSSSPALPGVSRGEMLRDTAFRFLVLGNTADRDAALAGLLDQAAQPGTNWSDTSRWNNNDGCLYNDAWMWHMELWFGKLLVAYDYIRHAISSADRATLDNWFTGHARLVGKNLTDSQLASRFVDRYADNYSMRYTNCVSATPIYVGGPTHCDFSEGWNNRNGQGVRNMAMIGVMTNNATFKASAKRYFQEWLRFAVWPDGTEGQMHRATADNFPTTMPGQGYHYSSLMIGSMITIADVFARSGDTSLYEYSTSLGDPAGAFIPAGGPKSLLTVMTKFMHHLDHTVVRYTAGHNGQSDFIIDSNDDSTGERKNGDNYLAHGNLYYKSAYIKSAYLRTAPGKNGYTTPPYPADVAGFGSCVYCGEWGIYPGILFMYGQMENLVNPYGTTSNPPQPPPSPSSETTVTVDSTYPEYSSAVIDDGIIDAKGGTATTWASADDGTTANHWIDIAFPLSRQLNTVTIHWAYNNFQQKYMTSQRVDVQYWNGSSYATVATLSYPGSDVPSSSVSFPSITTTQLRFLQPANQGNPTYTTVLWVTEFDYGFSNNIPAVPAALSITSTQ